MDILLRCFLLVCDLMGASASGFALSTTMQTVQMAGKSVVAQLPAQVTILVLDMSGSMSSNDGAGIRCSAANAYIDLNQGDDQIGIVAMTNTNGVTDTYGFPTASVWQQPILVGGNRQQLKNVIAQPPDGIPQCRYPSGSTPIYEALATAFAMLTKATHTVQGDLHGSVIVMSDGQPDPQPGPQMQRIRSDLLPRFLQKKWPIATIALNGQPDYLAFLHEIADKTDGHSYDDTKGGVAGTPSALNITDFFVQVLAQRQGRTVNAHVPVQTLAEGATWHKDVPIIEHTRHLDIVIAKDQGVTATLTTPEGRRFPPEPPEPGYITYTRDNSYYEIFSIDDPRPNTYSLDLSGQGQFLVYDLATSSLQVNITSPNQSVHALDQPFQIQAQVVDSQPGDDPTACIPFALSALIHYEGIHEKGQQTFTKRVDMLSAGACGTYSAPFPIHSALLPGLYSVTVSVSGDTSASIADASTNIRLVHAPYVLLKQQLPNNQQHIVPLERLQWPPIFQKIYDPKTPVLGGLGQFALQHAVLAPPIVLRPTIRVDEESMSSLAIIDATLNPVRGPALHLSVSKQKPLQIILPPQLAQGVYTLNYTLDGIFEDGSFQMHLSSTVRIIDTSPSFSALFVAGLITGCYGLCILLIMLFSILAIVTGPPPFGEMQIRNDTGNMDSYPLRRTPRRLRSFFSRHTLRSENVLRAEPPSRHLPAGLVLRFGYRKSIKVRCRADFEGQWRYKGQNGGQEQKLGRRLQKASSVIYCGEQRQNGVTTSKEYIIVDNA